MYGEKEKMELGIQFLDNGNALTPGTGRQGAYTLQVKRDKSGNELLYFSGYSIQKEISNTEKATGEL